MGNVAVKHPSKSHLVSSQTSGAGRGFRSKDIRKSSSASSTSSSSQDYLDAETDIHSSTDEDDDDEEDLEDLITRTQEELGSRAPEDAFMKAVLAFCSHMGGRMDSLDNARLYEEFCSYAASHTNAPPQQPQKVTVAVA